MRILFLRKRGEFAYASPLMFHEFEQAVGKIADCKWAGQGWPLYREGETIHETVKRIYGNDPPEWVIAAEGVEPLEKNRKYKVGHHISDLHGRLKLGIRRDAPALLKLINRMNYDAVFLKAPYIYGTPQHHGFFVRKLEPKWYFLPYSVNPEHFKPLFPKKWDVTLIGAVSGTYPIRRAVWYALPEFCEQHGLRLLRNRVGPRPTWTASDHEHEPQYYIRSRYAKALGQSHVLIFCGGGYSYPVQKYFEASASGCLPLAGRLRGIGKTLGFYNRKTYVIIDKHSWKEEILYYRENKDETQKIIENGRRLILKRHTHDIRAREFLRMLRGDV